MERGCRAVHARPSGPQSWPGPPFPGRAKSEADLKAVAKQVLAVAKRRDKGHVSLRAVDVGKLTDGDKATLMVDSHLISVPHAHGWAAPLGLGG